MARQTEQLTPDGFASWLESQLPALDEAMGETARRHFRAEDLVRVAVAAYAGSDKLRECAPISFLYALVLAGKTGLRIGAPFHEAYLIPRYNKQLCSNWAYFEPSYRGIVTLARRSGEVLDVQAALVKENDPVFEVSLGTSPRIEHVPARGDRGQVTHAYAVAFFRGGLVKAEVMDFAQLEHVRKKSKQANSGPWRDDTEEMYRKCPIKRIGKHLPQSDELAAAMAALDEAETGHHAMGQLFGGRLQLPATTAEIVDAGDAVVERVAAKAAAARAAAPLAPAPPPTFATIEEWTSRAEFDEDDACVLREWMGVERLADVPVTQLDRARSIVRAIELLNATGARIDPALAKYGVRDPRDLSGAQWAAIVRALERKTEEVSDSSAAAERTAITEAEADELAGLYREHFGKSAGNVLQRLLDNQGVPDMLALPPGVWRQECERVRALLARKAAAGADKRGESA